MADRYQCIHCNKNFSLADDDTLTDEVLCPHCDNTPLHYAAAANRYNDVRSLLTRQADPNIKDKNGKLPVELTTDKKSIDLLKAYMSKKK